MAEHAGALEALWVVVPAHDEEDLLPRCLAALVTAREFLLQHRPAVVVSLLVVLDRCRDHSEAICRQAGVATIAVDAGNVGAARAAGMDEVSSRAGSPEVTWVVSTDADSHGPRDWLLEQVELADAGADVVLGRVEPDTTAPRPVIERWHELHDDGRVGVHGAHLGVRLSAYQQVGGYRPLRCGEDVDLYDRLTQARVKCAAATRIVTTSSRLISRTTGGFASFLADLVHQPIEPGSPLNGPARSRVIQPP